MVAAIAGTPTEDGGAAGRSAPSAPRSWSTTSPAAPGSAMTCSARSSTTGCRRHGGRRCTSRVAGLLEQRRRPGGEPRRRSPTTAAWRGRWVTVTARSLRWPRRAGKRRPGRPSTRRPPICAAPSTSPAARRRPAWRRCASTGTRCAGPATARTRRPRSSRRRRAPARPATRVLFARAAFGAHRVATLTESSRSGVIALLEEALAALDGEPGLTPTRCDGCCPRRWRASSPTARS